MAIDNYRPSKWVLCIPVDLTIDATEWLQSLEKEYVPSTQLDFFCASHIIEQLFLRPHLAEAFFPQALLSPTAIKAAANGTADLDLEGVGLVASESHDQLIARLRQQDARFDYQVSYRPNPTVHSHIPSDLIASYFDGTKRIDLIARDKEALRLSPPQTTIQMKPTAREKLDRVFRKGTTEDFGPSEATITSCSFEYLLPNGKFGGVTNIKLGPHLPKVCLPFRIVVKNGKESAQLSYLEMRCTRIGTEEVEIESSDLSAPIFVRVVQGSDKKGTVGFARNYGGKPLNEVLTAVVFEKALARGGVIELYDLRHDALVAQAEIKQSPTVPLEGIEELVQALLRISAHFGWPNTFPERMTKEDGGTICCLLDLLESGRVSISKDTFHLSGELARLEDENSVEKYLMSEFGFKSDPEAKSFPLFGKEMRLGSLKIAFSRLVLEDKHVIAEKYRALSEGETLWGTFRALSDGELIWSDWTQLKEKEKE